MHCMKYQKSSLCLSSYERSEVLTCIGDRIFSNLFGSTCGDDRTAAVAAFGSQVDDVVGGLDEIEVMFDHHDRVAAVDIGIGRRKVDHVLRLVADEALRRDVRFR